jgi:hypothetical protein
MYAMSVYISQGPDSAGCASGATGHLVGSKGRLITWHLAIEN